MQVAESASLAINYQAIEFKLISVRSVFWNPGAKLSDVIKKKKTSSVGFIRFGVFTASTEKNVVFWDIKTQFVLHRRHITSPLQGPAS
jgi:hypothetical protein